METQDKKVMPTEIRGWNWGAFFFSWIWGVGNNVWISFLTFIPIFGFFWLFVLGVKGNEWAWEKGTWRDVEHFKKTQRKWKIASLCFILGLLIFFGLIFGGVFSLLGHSAVTKQTIQDLNQNTAVVKVLGSPITRDSFVQGSINDNGSSGSAALTFTVKGPKQKAAVEVKAMKNQSQWTIQFLEIKIPKQGFMLLKGNINT